MTLGSRGGGGLQPLTLSVPEPLKANIWPLVIKPSLIQKKVFKRFHPLFVRTSLILNIQFRSPANIGKPLELKISCNSREYCSEIKVSIHVVNSIYRGEYLQVYIFFMYVWYSSWCLELRCLLFIGSTDLSVWNGVFGNWKLISTIK